MTRKDYALIAAALKQSGEQAMIQFEAPSARNVLCAVFDTVTANVANQLARDNPRFDRSRFLAACGVQS